MVYPFWKLLLLVIGIVPLVTVSIYYGVHGQLLVALVWLLMGLLYGSFFVIGLWRTVGAQLARFGRFARPHLGRGAAAAGRGGRSAARAGWAHFRLRPWLFLGVITLFAAFWQFGNAYAGKGVDWKAFHQGIFLVLASGCFFIHHFKLWGNLWRLVRAYFVDVWLGASALSLAVTLGHALHLSDGGWWYMVVLSGVSLLCAIITKANCWDLVGKGLWKIFTFLGGFYSGKVGGWKGAVFTYATTLALASLYLFGYAEKNPEQDLEGLLYLSFGGFIILTFVGFFALIVFSVHGEKKKK